jgi:hypothetical protein
MPDDEDLRVVEAKAVPWESWGGEPGLWGVVVHTRNGHTRGKAVGSREEAEREAASAIGQRLVLRDYVTVRRYEAGEE